MSELVAGKNRWTLPSDALFRAARRLPFVTGARYSVRLGVFLVGIGLPLDPLFRAARRLLFDAGARCSVRLGVFCGCVGSALDPLFRSARRRLGVVFHWIQMWLGVTLLASVGF